MRKVKVRMDISLDGFVGAADRDVEGWMLPSGDDELTAHILGLLDHTGTHVMGRVAYEEMSPHWPTMDSPLAPAMNDKPKVVFSTTLSDPKWANTSVAQDVATDIARLKEGDTDGDILAHAGATFVGNARESRSSSSSRWR